MANGKWRCKSELKFRPGLDSGGECRETGDVSVWGMKVNWNWDAGRCDRQWDPNKKCWILACRRCKI